MLRPYQQDASDAIIAHCRKSLEPCLVEAATGAGKSHIIADVAHKLVAKSGKKVLCLAPSKELVVQNYKKYIAIGEKASFFSASVGIKSTAHDVVFGTPQTVVNALGKFRGLFCAVIIDEAHGVTNTVRKIVHEMRNYNQHLRVIGLTATPYRMMSGYIYAHHFQHGAMDEDIAHKPYFAHLVYSISAGELIDQGFLTRPIVGHSNAHYDTTGLELNKLGQYTAESVDRAFVGRGRLTSEIVADVIAMSADRRGVLLFAATIAHAGEILESLPADISAIVTGNTSQKERASILARFLHGELKYLVNVAVLTTGFDAPHVDVIAVLRATESPGLFQQIIGRGARLCEGKNDFLVLDFAGNIERHFPRGDIFSPEVSARSGNKSIETITAECPECGHENEFNKRPNPDKYAINDEGYFTDSRGESLNIPAHYGRRCRGFEIIKGETVRCDYRWTSKSCEECGGDNDIAARYCEHCRAEIVDPNEKLRREAALAEKANAEFVGRPVRILLERSRDGTKIIAKYTIAVGEKRREASEVFMPGGEHAWMRNKWFDFSRRACGRVLGMKELPIDAENLPAEAKARKRDKYWNVTAKKW